MLLIKENVDCTNFKEKYGFDESGECWAIKWCYGYDPFADKPTHCLYIDHRNILINVDEKPADNCLDPFILDTIFRLIKDGLVERKENG